MFKNAKRKKPKAAIKRKSASSSESEDESQFQNIYEIKRKRSILNSVSKTHKKVKNKRKIVENDRSLDQQSGETTILGQKHEKAMEEFINSELKSTEENNEIDEQIGAIGTDDDLFSNLAKEVVTVGTDAAGRNLGISGGAKEGDVGRCCMFWNMATDTY